MQFYEFFIFLQVMIDICDLPTLFRAAFDILKVHLLSNISA